MTDISLRFSHLNSNIKKLNLEILPIRDALVKLRVREEKNPVLQNAANSLENIAKRVRVVIDKYRPFIIRHSYMVEQEEPAQKFHKFLKDSTFKPKPPPENATSEDPDKTELDSLSIVPSFSVPFEERVHDFRTTYRMRTDIVNYLIDTNRLRLALHVAWNYQLPIGLFPPLLLIMLPLTESIATNRSKRIVDCFPTDNCLLSPLSLTETEYLDDGISFRDWDQDFPFLLNSLVSEHCVFSVIKFFKSKVYPLLKVIDSSHMPPSSQIIKKFMEILYLTYVFQFIFPSSETIALTMQQIEFLSKHFSSRRRLNSLLALLTRQEKCVLMTSLGYPQFLINALKIGDEESSTNRRMYSTDAHFIDLGSFLKYIFTRIIPFIHLSTQIFPSKSETKASIRDNNEIEPIIPGFCQFKRVPRLAAMLIAASLYVKEDYIDRMVLESNEWVSLDGERIINNRKNLMAQSGIKSLDRIFMSTIAEFLTSLQVTYAKVSPELMGISKKSPWCWGFSLVEASDLWNKRILNFSQPLRYRCSGTGLVVEKNSDYSFYVLPNGAVVSEFFIDSLNSNKKTSIDPEFIPDKKIDKTKLKRLFL